MNSTKYPLGFSHKNLACFSFSYIGFACGAFFSRTNLVCGVFDFSVLFGLLIHSY